MESEKTLNQLLPDFRSFFEEKNRKIEIDWSDKTIQKALLQYFWENRKYAMEEYITLKTLFHQCTANAREVVEGENVDKDKEWALKNKNFSHVSDYRARLEALEIEIFRGNSEVIDIVNKDKAKSLFETKQVEADKAASIL